MTSILVWGKNGHYNFCLFVYSLEIGLLFTALAVWELALQTRLALNP